MIKKTKLLFSLIVVCLLVVALYWGYFSEQKSSVVPLPLKQISTPEQLMTSSAVKQIKSTSFVKPKTINTLKDSTLTSTTKKIPNRIDYPEKIKSLITSCTQQTIDQEKNCQLVNQQLMELIKVLEVNELKLLLSQISRERSSIAQEFLWSLINSYESDKALKALREYYFDYYSISAPESFIQKIAFRFNEIATIPEIDKVVALFLDKNDFNTRRSYSLINQLSGDKFILSLENAYQQAGESKQKDLYLIIANINTDTAFNVLKNIVIEKANQLDDKNLSFYLRGLNFIKTDSVRESMLTSIDSDNRGERLAAYVVLQNFSDEETSGITKNLLETEMANNDELAIKLLKNALVRQQHNQ